LDDGCSKAWWVCGLRGLIAISLGVVAVTWPHITLMGLVALFAAFALASGIISVAGAIRNRHASSDWGLLLLIGFVSIGAGVLAIDHPAITVLALVLLMAAAAIITGVLDIVFAIELRRALRGEWLIVLSGLVSIAFGALVALFPSAGALAMVWLFALYAILTGVLFLSFAARAWRRTRYSRTRAARGADSRHRLQT
jgi:uncharacterized membrane protein HdeD (DUF308 family)